MPFSDIFRMRTDVESPRLQFVMRITVEIAEAIELGEIHGTKKRLIPIVGGSFEGPSLCGRVLQGGADWQMARPDGVLVLHARYTLQTQTGGSHPR